MLSQDQELLQKLSIKDLERTNAYLNDLTHGLELVRTFPQGVTIFGSARLPQDHKYCVEAFKLGRLLAENGHTVITGGGPGIMEAASHGAYEIGGRTIGLNIVLLHEQHPNPYLTEYMNFQYFFTRKVSLAMAAKVFVFFPGGFGTMDELSEILCLMQELKMPKMPIFLIGKDFWRNFDRAIKKMQDLKLIGSKDDQIFEVTNDIKKVVAVANELGHPKVSENYYDGFRESTLLAHARELSTKESQGVKEAHATNATSHVKSSNVKSSHAKSNYPKSTRAAKTAKAKSRRRLISAKPRRSLISTKPRNTKSRASKKGGR